MKKSSSDQLKERLKSGDILSDKPVDYSSKSFKRKLKRLDKAQKKVISDSDENFRVDPK